MSIDEVVTNSVGEVIHFNEQSQAMLYNKNYMQTLESLQMVYAKYNHEVSIPLANRDGNYFEVVHAPDRPKLELYLQ